MNPAPPPANPIAARSALLDKYAGQWAAFSADGANFIDADPCLETLVARLERAGHDSEELGFERFSQAETDDACLDIHLGGVELVP